VSSKSQDKVKGAAQKTPITIKKYANRRLYNTETSSYVTLDHLCHMVQDGVEFVVYDAKTGEDITRSVLTQIIVEEEAKGQNLLPINFLRQLISFYGHSMQWMVPSYLEQMMNALAENGKQNMAAFEQAMQLFSPFGQEAAAEGEATGRGGNDNDDAQSLEQLKAQVDLLQKQIESLSSSKPGD
jgi:polyhydroxyalkanoate synthesis repressor PhaR